MYYNSSELVTTNHKEGVMQIAKDLTEKQMAEIIRDISDAFFDYEYDPDDEGLVLFIRNREDMHTYMDAIIRAAYKNRMLYTTSDQQEGFLILSGDGMGSIGFMDGMKMIAAEKNALGGLKPMKEFISACFSDGNTIETRMRKAKRKFIRIEMLAVRKEYQKQGFMKQMLDYVYELADVKKVPVILDTDDKNKCLRYEHLGMKLERVRNCGGKLHMYDLIREVPSGAEKKDTKYQKLIAGISSILKDDLPAADAERIAALAEERYEELCAENSDDAEALKKHTFTRIYPGIAMYESMTASGIPSEKAVWYIREYFLRYCEKAVPHMKRAIALPGAAKRIPALFMKISESSFPPEAGFVYEFPERKETEARFNIVRCPYMETCRKYGCPEICRAFCDSDDTAYGNLHKDLKWGRTKTIGRGDDCCDFLLEYRKKK